MTDELVQIRDGKVVSPRVTLRIAPKIEKGALANVHALILHQTGGGTADSALESYKKGAAGAHFLIDSDGSIYQTARISQKCWHIGKIRSRCYELKSCTADELNAVQGILFNKNEAYSVRVKKLNEHESAKPYPERYPTNEDSLGIELVGGVDSATGEYQAMSPSQGVSLTWLVATLESRLGLTDADVYRHPQVSYKQQSEAASAKWK